MSKKSDEIRVQREHNQLMLEQARATQDKFDAFLTDDYPIDPSEEEQKALSERSLSYQRNYTPPIPRLKSPQNPHGMVDVVTFCSHDYFLAQRLHPWQQLILKLMYMGTEGNVAASDFIGLKVEKKRSESGCEGCIWKYNRDAEEELNYAQSHPGYVRHLNVMNIANSPCLTCNRLPQDIRDNHYIIEWQGALKAKQRNRVKELRRRVVLDEYTTEYELIFGKEIPETEVDQETKETLARQEDDDGGVESFYETDNDDTSGQGSGSSSISIEDLFDDSDLEDETEIIISDSMTQNIAPGSRLVYRSGGLKRKLRNQIWTKLGDKFSELILVLGRRSGKSFMVSIIALYEAYRFIMMGCPQAKYSMGSHDEIGILNVALAAGQAKGAIFDKIKEMVNPSPFFSNHIGKPATQTDLYLLTPEDKAENERRKAQGSDSILPGSIRVRSGNSNSVSQLGGNLAVIIIDEMAAMANANSDGGTDSDLYGLLKPSIATFGFDGKIICISNPLGPHGKFYELYKSSFGDSTTLMIQLASWLSNPTIPKEFLNSERKKDAVGYAMQYGAEFGSNSAEAWIPKDIIDQIIPQDNKRKRGEHGQPLMKYYMHIDGAWSSDKYTMCIVHPEEMEGVTDDDGRPLTKIIVDHLMYWEPITKGQPMNIAAISEYLKDVARRFHVQKVTYDQHWSSIAAMAELKKAGIRTELLQFNLSSKATMYQELYDLFTSERIEFYSEDTAAYNSQGTITKMINEVQECRNEFIALQRRWLNNRQKIEAIKGSNDDFPDCVAGAVFSALQAKIQKTLPSSRLALTHGYNRYVPQMGPRAAYQ